MQDPKFVIKPNGNQFIFHLIASNGEIILNSERYWSRTSAERAISSVKVNAQMDRRYDRRLSQRREPYFVLKTSNQEVLGMSEMYTSMAEMEEGIASVKKSAPVAGVEGG